MRLRATFQPRGGCARTEPSVAAAGQPKGQDARSEACWPLDEPLPRADSHPMRVATHAACHDRDRGLGFADPFSQLVPRAGCARWKVKPALAEDRARRSGDEDDEQAGHAHPDVALTAPSRYFLLTNESEERSQL